jgi:dihydrofolate reductase
MADPLIRYNVAQSLDGYIAPLDGSVDWLSGSSGGSSYTDFIQTIGGIVMGRAGFETELSFGPWGYGHLPVLVMTKRALGDPPQGVVTAAGDPRPALAALKARVSRGDIWLYGGGLVAGVFLDAGLIDRIEVTTLPVVLGAGRGLFAGAKTTQRLTLVESRADGSTLQSVYVKG